MVKKLQDKTPIIGKDCFIAETAAVIGDVKMGDQCSIWYSAVLRGDVNSIELGNRVNVQDCSVLHCTHSENGKVIIADDVIIGHNATVHGARVGSQNRGFLIRTIAEMFSTPCFTSVDTARAYLKALCYYLENHGLNYNELKTYKQLPTAISK